MNIAVVGAAGSVGREIARQIVAERMLDRDQTLQLAGNPKGISARKPSPERPAPRSRFFRPS